MATSIFDRQRQKVNEDRRTWAIFLALQRCPAFLKRFVNEALGTPSGDIAPLARTWPDGFGPGVPDGEIRVGEQVRFIFEAKVPGRTVTGKQVEKYLGNMRSFAGHTVFVVFTDQEKLDPEIVGTCARFGVKPMLLPHRTFVTLVRRWSQDKEYDAVCAFLCGELHSFFQQETGMSALESLEAGEGRVYRRQSEQIHHVDNQLKARLARLTDRLGDSIPFEEPELSGYEWISYSASNLGNTLFSIGITLTPPDEGTAWSGGIWFYIGEEDMATVHSLRDANQIPIPYDNLDIHPEADETGIFWMIPLDESSVQRLMDATTFDEEAELVADRMRGLAKTLEAAWPRFLEAYVRVALPHDLPHDLRDELSSWMGREASAGRSIWVGEDSISIGERRGKAKKVEVHWRGSPSFKGGRDDLITLWASPDTDRKKMANAPDWSDLTKGWRTVSLKSTTQLQRLLPSISAPT